MRRLEIAPSRTRMVKLTPATTRKVSPETVTAALGAQAVERIVDRPDTPIGFAAIRSRLYEERRSSGGRPGFADATRRKIPVTPQTWRVVQLTAEAIAEQGFRPSPSQVASVLLALASRQVVGNAETIEAVRHLIKASRTIRPAAPQRREPSEA